MKHLDESMKLKYNIFSQKKTIGTYILYRKLKRKIKEFRKDYVNGLLLKFSDFRVS
jgi:hypothetical protein